MLTLLFMNCDSTSLSESDNPDRLDVKFLPGINSLL